MSAKKPLFQHVGTTPIVPISLKILGIFICLLLLSNFATNYITLVLSQRQIINLTNTVMVSQLKDIYSTAGDQYQIYSFSGDRSSSMDAVKSVARKGFEHPHSIALAFGHDGTELFVVSADDAKDSSGVQKSSSAEISAGAENSSDISHFSDEAALATLNRQFAAGVTDGSVSFETKQGHYFGVYKYQSDWGCYFVRAELRADTQHATWLVLGIISLVIFVLVLGFLFAGLAMFRRVLANVTRITDSLYQMQHDQHLSLIDLKDAPNDDVTYLAASFNSLSSTINNLLGIFQKFVSKDVVRKAYSEHTIRLEGSQRNLTILFSDIKSFTYRTETLGNDIIDLLNIHYDRVIRAVHENDGVVGSIIGDAILAMYGTDNESAEKSLKSVQAAWRITKVTAQLREKMIERRKEVEKRRKLTEPESRIFDAVLIDIGVGIDGGNVFYGNIGSSEHMANTVIGDRVNSASRLEGLTRIYHLPVIVSGYLKDEVEQLTKQYRFYEIDTVQVKGKTEGMKIFFPLDTADCVAGETGQFDIFEEGLESYYSGDWRKAKTALKKCTLEVAGVFVERMGTKKAPADWSGIWTMTTK
jgi:adenylate cyclase